ncbi:unnamed protein product [Moneuplotes crassus]|uniref:Uncharacterized protein n=1 Tax=Euplotes crassus TaxID=5936 RepID=A0AAD1X773_EUPCR|nr:unnamed protein product [Moneuplotes crassus]
MLLGFTNKSVGLPINNLRLAEGNICADSEKTSGFSDREFYELSERNSFPCTKEIAGEEVHPLYDLATFIREDRLFADNKISVVTNRLPFYSSEDGEKYFWSVFKNTDV